VTYPSRRVRRRRAGARRHHSAIVASVGGGASIQLKGVANTVRALLDLAESTASNALSTGTPMKLRPRIIARAPVSRLLAVIANAMVGRVATPRVIIG
jgi:hypothetical protein